MKRQDYYPGTLPEQLLWLLNFANQLPQYATVLQLTAAELEDAVADARWVAYVIGPWRNAIRVHSASATKALELAQTGKGAGPLELPGFTAPLLPENVVPRPAGALKRVFRRVLLIKNHRACTPAIRSALRLDTIADSRNHPVPTFTLELRHTGEHETAVGKVRKWGHRSYTVQSRRAGEDWTTLGFYVRPTFTDKRPLLVPGQPELRDYRVAYIRKDDSLSAWSAEQTLTLSPLG